MHPPAGRSSWTRGIAIVLLASAFAVHANAWRFISDDAFISFRYARNLAEHGELVFNLGERVEGYTNFLWVVWLAVGVTLGVEPPTLAPVMTMLGSATALVLAVLWLKSLRHVLDGERHASRHTSFAELLVAALMVASPEFMVWSHGGLETSWATALTLAALLAWTRAAHLAWGLCTAAAALLRPDALLPIAVFSGFSLALRPGAARVRSMLKGLALAVAPLLLHLLWRRAYYGAWLPNTWTVKAHGALLRGTYGVAYVTAWIDAIHLVVLAPLVVFLRLRHVPLLATIASVVAYGYAVGGDFMAYSRFYLTATVALAVLVAWLLADASDEIARRGHERMAWLPMIVGGLMAALLAVEAARRYEADVARPQGWLDGKWEGVTAMDGFAKTGLRAGAWMRAHLPPSTTITVGAAGAVPYASGLPTVDAFGLVDPMIPKLAKPASGKHARPGHQLWAPTSYIERRDPDLLCHVGYRGERRPSSRHSHPAFRRGYAWACIDVSSGSAPQVYCCRRPKERLRDAFAGAARNSARPTTKETVR